MLFGNQKFRQEFMQDVRDIAQQKGLRIVYGSLIGSLPQGIQCYDSDYDSVFLYINPDFPDNIMDADKSTYEEVLYRYYPEDPMSVYDSLTYRELSSFFGFLKNPSIQHENRDFGLYYYFAEVLLSPYTWDPYGIQMKVLPLLYRCYDHEMMLKAFVNKVNLLKKNADIGKTNIYNYKFYIRKVLYAFFLEWSLQHHSFAPTYIDTVLQCSKDQDAARELKKILAEYRRLDIENYKKMDVSIIKEAHLSLEITKNEVLENFVNRVLDDAFKQIQESTQSERTCTGKDIQQIINVVSASLNEEPVKGVLE